MNKIKLTSTFISSKEPSSKVTLARTVLPLDGTGDSLDEGASSAAGFLSSGMASYNRNKLPTLETNKNVGGILIIIVIKSEKPLW